MCQWPQRCVAAERWRSSPTLQLRNRSARVCKELRRNATLEPMWPRGGSRRRGYSLGPGPAPRRRQPGPDPRRSRGPHAGKSPGPYRRLLRGPTVTLQRYHRLRAVPATGPERTARPIKAETAVLPPRTEPNDKPWPQVLGKAARPMARTWQRDGARPGTPPHQDGRLGRRPITGGTGHRRPGRSVGNRLPQRLHVDAGRLMRPRCGRLRAAAWLRQQKTDWAPPQGVGAAPSALRGPRIRPRPMA